MQLRGVVGGLIKKGGMMAAVELRVDIIFAGHLTGTLLILIIRVSMLEQDGKFFLHVTK